MLLGDLVESALSKVGVTSDRVSAWLGHECGCESRKKKLNDLHEWAGHVLSGAMHKPGEYLEHLMRRQ